MPKKPALFALLAFTGLLATAQPTVRSGKDYAVFFYVAKFQPGWQPLPETEAEAKALKTELETSYGFECKLVPNPTRQQIRDELAAWNNRLGPNDQVLYFFSMHGYYRPASDLGYLVAADGKYEDRYSESYLNYNDLRPYFSECKARHVLVALDACYSGSFGTSRERSRPDAPDYATAPDCATQVATALDYAGRQYVCSGNKDARAPAKSAFSAKFLEALRKGPGAEGLLFFDDLSYWLGKVRSPEPENGTFSGHDPGGDFVFVRKNACAPPPDRDGDGVPDTADHCPDTWGSQANGCPPEVEPDNTAADLTAWKSAKLQHTESAYLAYLRQFPQGEFKTLANQALRQLEAAAARQRDDTAWEVAKEKNTVEGYNKYIADYPSGLHRSAADAKRLELERTDNMLLIRGGTFQMGSADGDDGEKPVHAVTVSDFYLGKYEVTVAEFKAFIDATGYQTDAEKNGGEGSYSWNSSSSKWELKPGINWRHDAEGKLRPQSEYNHPVIHVSWNDATEYCKWYAQKTGKAYRLPTEAEWEYAAGNGSRHTKYSWGNGDPSGKKGGSLADLTGAGHFNWTKNATNIFMGYDDGYAFTAPVGHFDPNDFGLHDMTGNVWEWCSDWYASDYYKSSLSSNPQGPSSGSVRVMRGGSWGDDPQGCRVADRGCDAPGNRISFIGFRLARTK